MLTKVWTVSFPADKIIMTGNPVRQNVLSTPLSVEESRESFGLDPNKKTILLVGGSLGARTINRSVIEHLDLIKQSDVNSYGKRVSSIINRYWIR